MRQVLAKGLLAAAATTGVLGVAGGSAFADAGASSGSGNSPGVLSGNTVQAPVELPANVCGNSVDAVGALNPSFGNGCASAGGDDDGQAHEAQHGQRTAEGGEDSGGGASATGSAQNSPGVGSGNNAQAPVDVPVNACGNSVDVVGLLNPAFGNRCDSSSSEQEHADDSVPQHVTPESPRPDGPEKVRPGKPEKPRPGGREKPRADEGAGTRLTHQEADGASRATEPESVATQLARTGTQRIGVAAGTGAALVVGGAILYRRARTARR
ncbi:chaplin [Streptomyces sclerotialus]|uniref:chaplin n=1 Tax=Streptomyces sclerotialus TaxID=1957 RepID=UPI0004C8B603